MRPGRLSAILSGAPNTIAHLGPTPNNGTARRQRSAKKARPRNDNRPTRNTRGKGKPRKPSADAELRNLKSDAKPLKPNDKPLRSDCGGLRRRNEKRLKMRDARRPPR